jgi:type IV secretory pathway TrbD component
MGRPTPTATTGRTVVLVGYLVAVVLVGRPVWLALLLGVLLILVWVAPIALAPPHRRRSTGLSAGPQ